jgi:hypothetical protein
MTNAEVLKKMAFGIRHSATGVESMYSPGATSMPLNGRAPGIRELG